MRRLHGLAGRLVAGQALVILAGSVSLVLVSTALAPGIFHRHLREALGSVPAGELDHLDHAFQDTLLIALGAAIGVAALTALAISLLLAARIAAPIQRLAAAAQRVASGERDVRVALAGADELRAVSASFNAMAATLDRSERERRAFVSDIAHELRTPVATIDAYLEGIEDGVVVASTDTMATIRDQTARMRRLIDDLALLARAQEGSLDLHREPISLTSVVERATNAAKAAFAAKRVRLEAHADDVEIEADPDRLGEVLTNLLTNALRHTPADGAVTVTGETTRHGVRIVVADTGEGIAPDELERVFERFHRVDVSRSRDTGGSGLGLAISSAIVLAHGGSIHADSRGPGTGARLTVELPRR